MRSLKAVGLGVLALALVACTSSEDMTLLHREISDVQQQVEQLSQSMPAKQDLAAVESRMQRERFSWLVGKFAPSSGDLVFTKGGELLGLMVNKEYCLLLTEFTPAYHVQTGIGIGDQRTGVLLSQLYGQVARMPSKLQ